MTPLLQAKVRADCLNSCADLKRGVIPAQAGMTQWVEP
jgi:hypothetical protein